jgi:hypothetical protein
LGNLRDPSAIFLLLDLDSESHDLRRSTKRDKNSNLFIPNIDQNLALNPLEFGKTSFRFQNALSNLVAAGRLRRLCFCARAIATALCAVSGILGRVHLTGHRPVATEEYRQGVFVRARMTKTKEEVGKPKRIVSVPFLGFLASRLNVQDIFIFSSSALRPPAHL